MAIAMVPGTFSARRHAAHATTRLLLALTAIQAGAVLALGTVRPTAALTLAVLATMAFVNGWRSMVASALGMDTAPEDKVAVMAMRAAANQFGYLLGAAAGGLALAFGGYPALGLASRRCSRPPCSSTARRAFALPRPPATRPPHDPRTSQSSTHGAKRDPGPRNEFFARLERARPESVRANRVAAQSSSDSWRDRREDFGLLAALSAGAS